MSKKSGLSIGRPSTSSADRAKLMESLRDDDSAEPTKRVNFELPESKHRKLKILVAKSEHKSIRDFFTAYIDSLPNE